MKNNDKLISLLRQVINKLESKQIVFTPKQEKRIHELLYWAKVMDKSPTYVQNTFDVYNELEEILEEVKKQKLINWFGYTRDEYYELQWQPGDPQWEELTPDEDGNGCKYEEA